MSTPEMHQSSRPATAHILFVGDWSQWSSLLADLNQPHWTLTFTSLEQFIAEGRDSLGAALALVHLPDERRLSSLAAAAGQRRLPWLAWSDSDDPRLTLAAYEAGALAVLPAAISPAALAQTLANMLARLSLSTNTDRPGAGLAYQRYRRGEPILFEQGQVLRVAEGVISSKVIHPDGAEVLLGLFGPGQTLVAHPHDDCFIQLIAHTETSVSVRPWAEAASDSHFLEQLRAQLAHMEAWSAMQARPHVDQRVLGVLSLLAEKFGRPHPRGTLINVRLTHTQLASAVGATRTTITRTLGDLRKRGLLELIEVDDAEFFCLRKPEHSDHGLRAGAQEEPTTDRP